MKSLPADPNALRNAPRWVHATVWGLFALATLACIGLYAMYRESDVWPQWLGESAAAKWPSGEETHFSERIRPDSVFRTPANTFSNLPYVLVGLYMMAFALWDYLRKADETAPYAARQPALMAVLGFACMFLGFGSGFMHASLTSMGHWFDILGMYWSLTAVIALHWGRWVPGIPLGNTRLPTWPILAIASFAAAWYCATNDGRFGVLTLMLTLIITIGVSVTIDTRFMPTRKQYRWYALSIVSLATAYTIWRLDQTELIAGPDDWHQEHAIWHFLTALALGCMALYYRTELPVLKAGSPSPSGRGSG